MEQPHMRIAYWIPKATNTHSVYVILIVFPLEKWLHERASLIRYTYIACRITLYPLLTYLLHGAQSFLRS